MHFGIMAMQMSALIPPGLGANEMLDYVTGFSQAELIRALHRQGFSLIELGGDLAMFMPQTFAPSQILAHSPASFAATVVTLASEQSLLASLARSQHSFFSAASLLATLVVVFSPSQLMRQEPMPKEDMVEKPATPIAAKPAMASTHVAVQVPRVRRMADTLL